MVCLFEMLKSFMCLGFAGAAFLAVVATGGTAAQAQPAVMAETISVSEVQGAQEAWCDALVSISKAHDQGGLAKSKSRLRNRRLPGDRRFLGGTIQHRRSRDSSGQAKGIFLERSSQRGRRASD